MALRPRRRLTQHSAHRIVSPPGTEPVTLEAVRTLLRSPSPEENAFIETCILQARIAFEAATGIACITQTWKLTLDQWPGFADEAESGYHQMPRGELAAQALYERIIEMPRYPLGEISTISVYDEADNATAVTVADIFFVDTQSLPGRLCLRYGQIWPVAQRLFNAIEITYTAGFGATTDDVPAELKRAIEQTAVYLYDHRGEGCEPMNAVRMSGALGLASDYIRARF